MPVACTLTKRSQEEYIHSGWCQDSRRDPLYREAARASLVKMGLAAEAVNALSDQEVCARLGEKVCRMVQIRQDPKNCSAEGIPMSHRVALRCNKRVKCFDVLELERKLQSEPAFAATLSSYQRRKIRRKANTARQFVQLPCNVFSDSNCVPPKTVTCGELSGNRDLCQRVNRCRYAADAGIRRLFRGVAQRYPRRPGQCFLDAGRLKALTNSCLALDQELLQSLVVDVFEKYVYHSRVGISRLSLQKQTEAKEDRLLLAVRIRENVRRLPFFQDRQLLCSWLRGRTRGKPNRLPWIKFNISVLVFALDTFQAQLQFFSALQYNLKTVDRKGTKTPVKWRTNNDDLYLPILTGFVNVVKFAASCESLGVARTVDLFPASRYAVRALFTSDPVVSAVMFMVSLVFMEVSAVQVLGYYLELCSAFALPRLKLKVVSSLLASLEFKGKQFRREFVSDTNTAAAEAWGDFYGKVVEPLQQVVAARLRQRTR